MPEQVSSLTILRQIFLAFVGLLFIFAIVLNILMRVPSEHHYCMTHDKHITDEEYLSAVINFLEQRYRMDNRNIKNEMKKRGLPSDEATIMDFRKEYFRREWNGQPVDFSQLEKRVSRGRKEYSWFHNLLGIHDYDYISVGIGYSNSWSGGFSFDLCGVLRDSTIGERLGIGVGMSVEKMKEQKNGL